MMPPPLPTVAHEIFPAFRRALAVLSLVVVAAGLWISGGALYFMAGLGVATAAVRGLGSIHLINNIYLAALFVFGVIYFTLALVLAAFVIPFFIAVRKTVSKGLLTAAYRLFATLSLFCFVGLIAANIIQNGRDGRGFDVKTYYFLWPTLFAAVSIAYRRLSLKFRVA